MLLIHLSASKSKSVAWSFSFLTSWWALNGRFHVTVGIVWEVTLLILGVNEYTCLGEEERGKRATVIPSLHQLWTAALALKILWSDLETSLGVLLSWSRDFCSAVGQDSGWFGFPGHHSHVTSVPSFREEAHQWQLGLQSCRQMVSFLRHL